MYVQSLRKTSEKRSENNKMFVVRTTSKTTASNTCIHTYVLVLLCILFVLYCRNNKFV